MKQSDTNRRMPFIWRMILISVIAIICFTTGSIILGQRKTVLVGYPLIKGFQDINEKGEFYGYNHEIIQRIAKYNKWDVEYVVGTFDELYERVRNGEIDVLGGVNDLRKNIRNEVAFAQHANGSDRSIILSNSFDSSFNDYNALDSKRIGFLNNSRAYDEFYQLARKYQIRFYTEFYDDYEELMIAMNHKRVDAVSLSSQYAFPLDKLIAEHHLSDYYFVTTLDNAEILSDINQGLAQLQNEQPTLTKEMHHYFYQGLNTTAFPSRSPTQQGFIFHISSFAGLACLVILFICYIVQSAEQKQLKSDFVKAMLNDAFAVSFIPIASYQDNLKKMFVIQYYCNSKNTGYVKKEQMMRIKGFLLPTLFRFHEFRVIFRSIREVLLFSSYQKPKFIISMHANYLSWWSLAQLSFILRFFMNYYKIPPNVLLISYSSKNAQDHKTKFLVNKTCSKLGISFVMNDFGMQFSSLSQIKKIDYEYFKVDRIYTSDFTYNDLSLQIIKLIVNIAASLQKEVIIDGIDDEETYVSAKNLGCHYMQGNYVGSEMTLQELLDNR